MIVLLPLYLLLLITLQQVCSSSGKEQEQDTFVVAGYLPEYRRYININNTAPFLTDLIIFSLTPDSKGDLGDCCLEDHHFERARQARAYKQEHYPDANPLKLFLTIGGAGRSKMFPMIFSNDIKRSRFIKALKQKCRKEELDGIDFDWEGSIAPEEVEDYMTFVKAAYEELTVGAGIEISIALHPRHTFPETFYQYVSRINLMTYDMITKEKGHHAKVGLMQAAIETLLDSGCPANKILVGIPAYGRHKDNPGMAMTYSEIVDGISQRNPDATLKDIAHQSAWKGFMFDSPTAVREKVHYTVAHKLKGVFFWEIGQDKQHEDWAPGGMLLEAAADQLSNSITTFRSDEL